MTALYMLNRTKHWLNGKDLTALYTEASPLIIHEAQ